MSARARAASAAARIVAAALVAAAGWIHLHLWMSGYSEIGVIGPLFLLDAVSSGVMALALLVAGRRPVLAAGVVLELGAIGGLAVASTVGLFGFRETGIGVQGYIVGAYATEAAAVAALAVSWLLRWRSAARLRSVR